MRGIKRIESGFQFILLIGCGLLFGWCGGGSDPKGGYLQDSQGVAHYTYVNGEYIPVPYAYNVAPNVSTFQYRNPPVFGNNLDQLQGSSPGLYAKPFTPRTPYFYR